MKQLAPGIIVLDNGLHYFSADCVYQLLRNEGMDVDAAAAAVGKLIRVALTAEFKEDRT